MLRFTTVFIVILGLSYTALTTAEESPTSASTRPSIDYLETGYLENTQGFVGDVLGAEITRISESDQFQIIEIDVPIDPVDVDHVRVLSKSGEVIQLDRTSEIIRDYENNNVGIKLYLPKQKNWVFRLKLIEGYDPR